MDRNEDLPPPNQRGFALGPDNGAALGPVNGSSLGPQRADRYRIRLTAPNGRRINIESTIAVDVALEYSAVSDISVEVPRLDGLADFRLGELVLFYGDTRLFTATLEKFPGPGLGDQATLYGRGPARELARSPLSTVSFSSRDAHDAIAEVWREHTDFDATVIVPNSPTTLSDFSTGGTVLEALQDLHEQAGMRFTVLQQQTGTRVESYVPDENVKVGDWTAVDYDSEGDMTEYANRVEVYGGEKSGGGRAFGAVEDTTEIDRLGIEAIRVDDSSITTDADAQARAESALAERVDSDTLSGSLEIIPQLVLPGYIYQIDEWEREDGTIPELTVSKTKFTESPGSASASLDVNAADGVEEVVTALRRETARLNQP